MFKFNDYFYPLLGLESFLYWSTFIISGMFLFTHITSLTQVLESKIPPIAKIVSLKSQNYLYVKSSYVSAPWVPGNLVVHVGHCLHLQVHLLELHLDFLLGSFGCFFDRFVFQVQELPVCSLISITRPLWWPCPCCRSTTAGPGPATPAAAEAGGKY